MAGETSITIVGNLTADPELRFTPQGHAVAKFSVAVTPRTFDRQTNEWKDGNTTFHNCQVWRQYAENVTETLRKGMKVIVKGDIESRTYETDKGEKRTVWEIEVEEVGVVLRNASAVVTKNPSNGSHSTGQAQPDPWATATPAAPAAAPAPAAPAAAAPAATPGLNSDF